MSLTFILGLAFAAGSLAHTAARKRNRHAALWAVICFCFPIALLAIWSMNSLPPRMVAPASRQGVATKV